MDTEKHVLCYLHCLYIVCRLYIAVCTVCYLFLVYCLHVVCALYVVWINVVCINVVCALCCVFIAHCLLHACRAFVECTVCNSFFVGCLQVVSTFISVMPLVLRHSRNTLNSEAPECRPPDRSRNQKLKLKVNPCLVFLPTQEMGEDWKTKYLISSGQRKSNNWRKPPEHFPELIPGRSFQITVLLSQGPIHSTESLRSTDISPYLPEFYTNVLQPP